MTRLITLGVIRLCFFLFLFLVLNQHTYTCTYTENKNINDTIQAGLRNSLLQLLRSFDLFITKIPYTGVQQESVAVSGFGYFKTSVFSSK